ncbi:MAG: hypothetical protein A3C55_00920 [Gammaproteobacteria bacterium RIFCSPHIGHO2_02_FULL_42_13]|nr:MAG: hypothetical protein A3C55_00920 [Gammaproteobacteria bacterium RIFCSPHIGHO2_02_FULL_42_13]OGT69688.1 MAG: hypothetical protein A3H43_01215 [Gammaproteobacteria bacterium RIFCSPLOWO2_02_FULL_42_9]
MKPDHYANPSLYLHIQPKVQHHFWHIIKKFFTETLPKTNVMYVSPHLVNMDSKTLKKHWRWEGDFVLHQFTKTLMEDKKEEMEDPGTEKE